MGTSLKEHDSALATSSIESLRIQIIGVGGAGTHTADRLQFKEREKLEFAAINTDAQALAASSISEKLMIGKSVTRGLGTGGSVALGIKAAEVDVPALLKLVSGVDLVFVLVGLGGGTGSGAAPRLAQVAQEQGALVVTFANLPFSFEGGGRLQVAEQALSKLRQYSDAVIPLPNDLLLQHTAEDATVLEAFAQADVWIGRGIRGICAMVLETGLINVDFATLRQAFCVKGGKTLFGLGRAEGDRFVDKALQDLAMCPLLHTPEHARKADRLLVNIIGGTDLGIGHVNTILDAVSERFGSKVDTVLGAVIDESACRSVEITVIGTTHLGHGHPHLKHPTNRALQSADATASLQALSETERPHGQESKMKRADQEHSLRQEEFAFVSEEQQRGYFDETDRNLFEGEDLDLPTYLRHGIRIRL